MSCDCQGSRRDTCAGHRPALDSLDRRAGCAQDLPAPSPPRDNRGPGPGPPGPSGNFVRQYVSPIQAEEQPICAAVLGSSVKCPGQQSEVIYETACSGLWATALQSPPGMYARGGVQVATGTKDQKKAKGAAKHHFSCRTEPVLAPSPRSNRGRPSMPPRSFRTGVPPAPTLAIASDRCSSSCQCDRSGNTPGRPVGRAVAPPSDGC